jgi:membrane protease YdiL (CAAX protease family)
MSTSHRYSRRQLTIAKCLVVAASAVVGGANLADSAAERPLTIVVVLVMLGGALVLYELLARGLARMFGRVWPPPALAVPDPEPEPSRHRQLRLWQLVVLVGGFFAAQASVWVVGAAIVGAKGAGTTGPAFTAALLQLTPMLLPAGTAAGGLVLALTLRAWEKQLGMPTYAAILAARWGTNRQLSLAAAGGLLVGIAYLALTSVVPYEHESPSLVVQAASTPGATRWAWIISALFLAPPIEEALFRGALLGGLEAIWSLPLAAVTSGLTFWALHATEWAVYWPAAIGLGLLTIFVTVLRLRTRALGACIAAHCAYNLVLVVAAFGFGAGSTV